MTSSFPREYCPSYCDDRGTFHPGFNCSRIEIENTGDTLFCCGTPDKPYCCHDADLQLFEVPENSSACPDSYRWNGDYIFTFIPVIVVIWIVYYVCKNCSRPRQHARSNTNQVQQTATENANRHPRSSDSPPDTPPIAFYLTQYNGTGNGIVTPGDITLPPSYDDVVMPSSPPPSYSAIWGQTNEAFQPDDTTTATSDNHSPHNSSHHSSSGSNNRIHPSPPSYSSLPLETQSTVDASSSTTPSTSPSTSPSTTSTLDLSTSQPPHDDDTDISTNNVAAAPAANGDVTEHVTQTSPPRHVTSIGAIDSNAHARTENIFSATSSEAEDTVIEMQSLAQSSSLTDSSYEDSSDDA